MPIDYAPELAKNPGRENSLMNADASRTWSDPGLPPMAADEGSSSAESRPWIEDRVYRRTLAGEAALRSEDAAIPSAYKRLLRLIGADTHSEVIRGALRRFPDSLIFDWLAEFEELGCVCSASSDPTQDLDFRAALRLKIELGAEHDPEDFAALEA